MVIKVRKPNQDPRFDLPAVGLDTVRSMHEAGSTALAVDAGETVVFDQDDMVRFSDAHGIAIVGIKSGC